MQMQALLETQSLEVIGEVEQFQSLCAWAEVAGIAVADSYEDRDSLNATTESDEEPSLWEQVKLWSIN